MSRAARLMLVAVMLLTQFALGQEVRFCAPSASLKPEVAPAQRCEKLCCCPKTSHKANKGEKCEVKKAKQPVADTFVVPSAWIVPAILPVSLPIVAVEAPTAERTTPPHLVVPRTRAPDIGGHLLRAPPTR